MLVRFGRTKADICIRRSSTATHDRGCTLIFPMRGRYATVELCLLCELVYRPAHQDRAECSPDPCRFTYLDYFPTNHRLLNKDAGYNRVIFGSANTRPSPRSVCRSASLAKQSTRLDAMGELYIVYDTHDPAIQEQLHII
jgi:hypothetical protein